MLAAAHAGCFTMKLSAELSQAGFTPEELTTKSVITLDPSIGKITKSELTLTAKVPGISEEDFQKYAKIAEEGCPVSAAFNFEITLNATLA